MSSVSLEEAVSRGAALLDKKKPGWAAKINTQALYMESPCHCIVGQLFGGYNEYISYLGAFPTLAFGFEVGPTYGYISLKKQWLLEINKRVALGKN